MPIFKVKDASEKYKKIAKHLSNRNELTGRNLKSETKKRIDFVKKNLLYLDKNFSTVVDVGCGDGSFLEEFSSFIEKDIGVLPSDEEIEAVSKILKDNKVNTDQKNNNSNYSISLVKGNSEELPFKDQSIDLIFCNSVLHGVGYDEEKVKNSIKEFSRVQTNGSILYIGEIPELDEMNGRTYGNSYLKYLFWVVKNRGFIKMILSLLDYLYAKFSKKIYIIQPSNIFYCSKIDFVKLINEFGYELIEIFDSSTNIKVNLYEEIEKRRLDYLFKKKH